MTNFKAGDKVRFRADRKELYDGVFGSGDVVIGSCTVFARPAFDDIHEVLRVYPCDNGITEQTQRVLLVGCHDAHSTEINAIGGGWFEEAV